MDRHELAREVMRSLDMGDHWVSAVDPDSPPWLVALQRETVDAYRAGDLEWLFEHTDPEIEIVQPRELPDGRTYRGLEGLIDALLDWPGEWEDFRVEPKRIFAPDDTHVIVNAVHRGRSLKMGIDVEVEIAWLYTLRDERVKRWDMFLRAEDALRAARSSE